MANFSSTYPSTRPVFNADFSNAGRLDSRITFSRSDTPPTYAAPSAVHYWSNEKHLSSDNLLLQSSDFDTTWANSRLASPTANQTDPSGGTDGYTLTEDSSSGAHRLTQSVTATGDLAFTVYAKQNSGTRYLTLGFFNGNNDTVLAVYDLAGGSPVTATGSSSTYSSVSTSQTASGNGYYKCVLKATGTVTLAGVNLNDASTTAGLDTTLARKVYTGDGSSSIDVAFASLSSVGGTTYQATTTQIHREYAPTLKSVSTAGQPRFEYSPTDSASMGLLVEGQAQNLIARSDSIDNAYWTKNNTTITAAAAVGVTGVLNACLITEIEDVSPPTSVHSVYSSSFGLSSATSCTLSVYCKPAGVNRVQLLSTVGGSVRNAVFNIGNGTVISETSATGAVEAVGNGFYRISITYTAPATTNGRVYLNLVNDSGTSDYVGNGYNSVITSGFQFEQNSFASSFISSDSGSATTRAADSASMVDANLFDTGSGAIICELGPVAGTVYPTAFALTDSSTQNIVRCQGNNGATQMSLVVNSDNSGVATITQSFTPTGTKLAVSYDTNSFKLCTDGGTVGSDTAGQVPEGLNRLEIGGDTYSSSSLSGHVKRIALYGEALSDTNLQALTS